MWKKSLLACLVLCTGLPLAVAAPKPAKSKLPRLSASQIIAKNIKARGGLASWRAIKTMSMSGTMEAGGKDNVELPFVMRLKRPRQMEFELKFHDQTAMQVYDGKEGWKLRPFLNRTDVEPYTPEEMKKAADMQDLDGPLVDYAAKGTKVALDGTERVDGRDAYRLKLTLKDHQVRHVWIDGESFLEVKLEGSPRVLDGKERAVATYLRDYKPVNGLKIPFVYETAVEGVKATHKMRIEKVELNPRLDDSLFAKPNALPKKAPVIVTAGKPGGNHGEEIAHAPVGPQSRQHSGPDGRTGAAK